MYGTTGRRNLRRNQTSELNARLGLLPSILETEQRAQQSAKDEAFREKQFAQGKKQASKTEDFQQEQAKRGLGLEVTKMGVNLGTSPYFKGGGPTVNSMMGNNPNANTSDTWRNNNTGTSTGSGGGYFSNMPIGSGVSGGLAGYGVASMMGQKSKTKRTLWGTGAGMLTGMLSGGWGGAGAGAIGGLFGGLMS